LEEAKLSLSSFSGTYTKTSGITGTSLTFTGLALSLTGQEMKEPLLTLKGVTSLRFENESKNRNNGSKNRNNGSKNRNIDDNGSHTFYQMDSTGWFKLVLPHRDAISKFRETIDAFSTSLVSTNTNDSSSGASDHVVDGTMQSVGNTAQRASNPVLGALSANASMEFRNDSMEFRNGSMEFRINMDGMTMIASDVSRERALKLTIGSIGIV